MGAAFRECMVQVWVQLAEGVKEMPLHCPAGCVRIKAPPGAAAAGERHSRHSKRVYWERLDTLGVRIKAHAYALRHLLALPPRVRDIADTLSVYTGRG